jgi:hypothetical protein
MRISNKRIRWVKDALHSVREHCNPIEILATVPPDMPFDPAKRFGVKMSQFEGFRDRSKMNRPWMDLYDRAVGEWIVNLDDDDIALCPIVPSCINDDIGLIHGNVVSVYIESSDDINAGNILLRRSAQIGKPEDANLTLGSYLAVRNEAWQTIKDNIDRDCVGYSDYRMTWHLIKAGWSTLHLDRFIQVQRARPVTAGGFCSQVVERTGGWPGVVKSLEAEYGHLY